MANGKSKVSSCLGTTEYGNARRTADPALARPYPFVDILRRLIVRIATFDLHVFYPVTYPGFTQRGSRRCKVTWGFRCDFPYLSFRSSR